MRTQLLKALMTIATLVAAGPSLAAGSVTIGSTNFAEQLILANIYGDVLEARGVDVELRLNLGSREIVFPALKAGEIDVLPEYTGALLSYLSKDPVDVQSEQEVANALKQELPEGLVMLKPASAQDKDTLVVTQETAKKYDLQSVSDLKGVAGQLVMGGPPEEKIRPTGLPGLKKVYGLEFKAFRALDAGGPLTVAALKNGSIDIARMFTTQGIIDANNWVVLADDKNLVLAQNLVPIVREQALTPTIRKALNAVSAELTTEGLQKLNAKVGVHDRIPRLVAEEWAKEHGLLQAPDG